MCFPPAVCVQFLFCSSLVTFSRAQLDEPLTRRLWSTHPMLSGRSVLAAITIMAFIISRALMMLLLTMNKRMTIDRLLAAIGCS